ncbi:MAG: pilus assembly protein PilM [Dehalococcoidales bacterium]|nr:pilus assembly protein PilM [Dehalococcoidales bacterium]
MAQKTTSLYIDDDGIKLLVNRGERIKRWGKVKISPGLVQGMTIPEPAKLAEQITLLMKKLNVRAKKVDLSISAQQCLTRQIMLPNLPKALLTEAVTREARRILPISPEELYLSWQIVPAPENKLEVFLIGLLRKNIDPLLAALKLANLKVNSLVLKPMALARLIKEPNALLVDVQPTEFDIVLMVRGIPNPMRTVPFSSAKLTWEEKAPIILDEIDRTLKFYLSNNPESPLPGKLPAYFSGDLNSQDPLCAAITERFDLVPAALTANTDHPTGFRPQLYMVNVAMSKQGTSSIWNPVSQGLTLNILPEEHRVKTIKWTRVLPVPVTLVLIGVTVPMVILTSGASVNIAAARAQLDAANQILQEKQLEKQNLKKDIKAQEDTFKTVSAELLNVTLLLNTLTTTAQTKPDDINMIMSNQPENLILDNFTLNQNTLVMTGNGDEATILDYARSLRTSQRFSLVTVDNITRTVNGDYTFSLTVTR